jgi:YebC/PmpR family DNA-binding regulatory protein
MNMEVSMSGHSKWSTIKHKKGKVDAARGKLFTKLIKEITVAARQGGGDETGNARLRTAVIAARASNMPMDNIDRAVKRGTGELEGVNYDELVYEGYGPEGVAVLVDVLTDNKNRSVSEIRSAFGKHNGKMAEMGSVAWVFSPKGRVVIAVAAGLDEDAIMEATLEAGADDIQMGDESIEIFCEVSDLTTLQKACEEAEYTIEEAGLVKVPSTTVILSGRPAQTMINLMEALDDCDDVQDIWTNFDIDEKTMESMA